MKYSQLFMKFKKLNKIFGFSIYMNKVKIFKNNLFTKHLLLTNLAISTTTSGIGDVIDVTVLFELTATLSSA